jgi:hypothetical protein
MKTVAFAVVLLLGYEENKLSQAHTFSAHWLLGDGVI